MITVVIPARMASSRFPGKPLASILGLPMIEHVRRRALLEKGVDQVVVATCDQEIKIAVESYGGKALMTKDTHERCTDRVEEAMQQLTGDIVVMVQGDEPLLTPQAISLVANPLLEDPNLDVVNLLSPLESSADYSNPNIVKAVCSQNKDVIYLTRAAVPFLHEKSKVPVYRQTGIIAFRTEFLKHFSSLAMTPLEQVELIDMLRVLEYGHRIKGVVFQSLTIGVDRPNDIVLVENAIEADLNQMKIFTKIMH